MFDIDLFNFFRYLLAMVATIYASIITYQSLKDWYVWLAGRDRYVSLLRRYVVVHGLRLRFTSFWADLVICALLCVVFLILFKAHGILHHIDMTLHGSGI
jgi:uncharacterized membrane protein YjjB (DUF3815 family)